MELTKHSTYNALRSTNRASTSGTRGGNQGSETHRGVQLNSLISPREQRIQSAKKRLKQRMNNTQKINLDLGRK